MTPDQCCGRPEYHCRWCGEHKVVTTLVQDHEQECNERSQVGAA